MPEIPDSLAIPPAWLILEREQWNLCNSFLPSPPCNTIKACHTQTTGSHWPRMSKINLKQIGRRRCLNIEYSGETLNTREWSQRLGIPIATLNARIRAKNSIVDIFRPLHSPSLREEEQMEATALRVKEKRQAKNRAAQAERQESAESKYRTQQHTEIYNILRKQESELAKLTPQITENDCF